MSCQLEAPRQAVAGDLAEIAGLLTAAFPKTPRNWVDDLRWQYLENPCGRAWMANARDDNGGLVGHYAVIPTLRLADVRFEKLAVYLSLNTAVHPRAQGKGLFKKTASALYAHLQSLQPSVVLGVGNANSTPGLVGSLAFYGLGSLHLRAFMPFGGPSVKIGRTLDITEEYVSWRISRPHARGHVRPDGAVVRTVRRAGVPVTALLSSRLPLEKRPEPTGTSLGVTVMYAGFGRPDPGGLSVPSRFRPRPLNFVCRPLPDQNSAALVNYVSTHAFEFIDFDVV